MKITIDTTEKTLVTGTADGGSRSLPLYSTEAFDILSDLWLKVGWDRKYSYSFTWMGRPIIQLPEDVLRIQEVIWRVQPDVIVETGIAHGGSLLLSATLCKAMGKGRVIGVDIEIRPHNREALERHILSPLITLIEGSSVDQAVVRKVKSLVNPGERVLVILDSCHTKAHVLAELEAYHDMVAVGSYIVATDGIMRDLSDVQAGKPDWTWDNPCEAAREFLGKHEAFVLETPAWSFNESHLSKCLTYWPDAYLRRVR